MEADVSCIPKCNENTGIGKFPKMKVLVSDSFWKKWYRCIPRSMHWVLQCKCNLTHLTHSIRLFMVFFVSLGVPHKYHCI